MVTLNTELRKKIEREWKRAAPRVHEQTPLVVEFLLHQIEEAAHRYGGELPNVGEVYTNATQYLLKQELLLMQIDSYKIGGRNG
jgi:hypothetical protein